MKLFGFVLGMVGLVLGASYVQACNYGYNAAFVSVGYTYPVVAVAAVPAYPVAVPTVAAPITYSAPVCDPATQPCVPAAPVVAVPTFAAPVAYSSFGVAVPSYGFASSYGVNNFVGVRQFGFNNFGFNNFGFSNVVAVKRFGFNNVVVARGGRNVVSVRNGFFGRNNVVVARGGRNVVSVRNGFFGNSVVVANRGRNIVSVRNGLFGTRVRIR